MYMCVYVCVYVYDHVDVYVYVYVHACICTYTYIYMYVCMYVGWYMDAKCTSWVWARLWLSSLVASWGSSAIGDGRVVLRVDVFLTVPG